MDKETKVDKETLVSRLDLIETLVQEKKFKQALAEIRDLDNLKKIDESSLGAGNFYYLSSIALLELGNYKRALSSGKKAFEIFRNAKDEESLARVQLILSRIYKSIGDFKSAELELRDVFSIYRRNSNLLGMIDSCNELAELCYIQSDYKRSVDFLNEAKSYCKKLKDFKTLARISGNIGRIYIQMCEWQLAEKNLLLSAKENRKNNDKINLCRSLLALGYVHFLKREFTKAKNFYNKALVIIKENNYVREYAIYHEYSGELSFAQGDYESAYKHYSEALEIGEKIAPKSGIISQTYRLLADLQIAKKDYKKAFECCNRSLEVCLSLGERIEEACCYRIFGQIHSFKKEKEKAKQNFEKSIQVLQEIGARYELAKAYLESGKSSCFDFFERLKFLGLAGDIFKDLKVPFWIAQVKFVIANLFFENQQYYKSLSFLDEAEKIFESSKDESDLLMHSQLKKLLEFKQTLKKNISGESITFEPNLKFSFSNIVTQNPELCEIKQKIEKIKDTDLNILLEGETGTGKDLFAKVIHYTSKRKDKNFVVLSADLPESLLESELFGYKKGAFTGAVADKKGLLEEAEGGTLFLDEIGYLPLSIQGKLLRIIEEKEFRKIGDTKPKKIDVRIIAASNKNLEEEVKKGNFRKDLYCRLNTIKFILPPLRERKEDISLLVKHFTKLYSKDGNKLSDETLQSFLSHDWPGNIRELENEIKRMLALGTEEIGFALDNCVKDTPDEQEKKQIIQALKKCKGIRSKAAKLLGIPRTTLLSKIERFNIKIDFH